MGSPIAPHVGGRLPRGFLIANTMPTDRDSTPTGPPRAAILRSPTPSGDRPTRRAAIIGSICVILVLVAVNIIDHEVSGITIWLGLPCAAGLLVLSRAMGLSWDELGLGRDHLRSGSIWAGC